MPKAVRTLTLGLFKKISLKNIKPKQTGERVPRLVYTVDGSGPPTLVKFLFLFKNIKSYNFEVHLEKQMGHAFHALVYAAKSSEALNFRFF